MSQFTDDFLQGFQGSLAIAGSMHSLKRQRLQNQLLQKQLMNFEADRALQQQEMQLQLEGLQLQNQLRRQTVRSGEREEKAFQTRQSAQFLSSLPEWSQLDPEQKEVVLQAEAQRIVPRLGIKDAEKSLPLITQMLSNQMSQIEAEQQALRAQNDELEAKAVGARFEARFRQLKFMGELINQMAAARELSHLSPAAQEVIAEQDPNLGRVAMEAGQLRDQGLDLPQARLPRARREELEIQGRQRSEEKTLDREHTLLIEQLREIGRQEGQLIREQRKLQDDLAKQQAALEQAIGRATDRRGRVTDSPMVRQTRSQVEASQKSLEQITESLNELTKRRQQLIGLSEPEQLAEGDKELIEEIKAEAKKRGVPVDQLIQEWMEPLSEADRERFQAEMTRLGLLKG